MHRAIAQVRADLSARLWSQRDEIEQAVWTRVCAVSDPGSAPDPRYADGLRRAVGAAIDYGCAGLEHGERNAPPIPAVLLVQARLAARNRVSLDTVLRRYFVGNGLLADYLIAAAEQDRRITSAVLRRLIRDQTALFERLAAKLSEEHIDERARRQLSSGHRRAERVTRLLEGELLDTSELAYPFDASHLGMIAVGAGAATAVRRLASALDRPLLSVQHDDQTTWAWLSGKSAVDFTRIQHAVSRRWPRKVALAVGEPGNRLNGWRLSHLQAKAALPIALRRTRSLTRYADVALLASMLQDDILAISLRELYLDPLAVERDGGVALRATLRAYFSTGRNISSTAAALKVSRQTVANRLSSVERHLDRPLHACSVEIEAALRLEAQLNPPTASEASSCL